MPTAASPRFFIGMGNPSHAWPFRDVMISVNAIRSRKSSFYVNDWILDSGAFTEISTHGRWRTEPEEYAEKINRWKTNGNLVAAVTQDYMCEPFILEKTGLTVEHHQALTIERYQRLLGLTDAYILPFCRDSRRKATPTMSAVTAACFAPMRGWAWAASAKETPDRKRLKTSCARSSIPGPICGCMGSA